WYGLDDVVGKLQRVATESCCVQNFMPIDGCPARSTRGNMQLLTAKQVAERYGLPSTHTVRTMMTRGLPYRRFGQPYLFVPEEVEEFIASKKEVMWRDETEVRTSSSSPSAGSTTSSGASTGSPAARARARTTAE